MHHITRVPAALCLSLLAACAPGRDAEGLEFRDGSTGYMSSGYMSSGYGSSGYGSSGYGSSGYGSSGYGSSGSVITEGATSGVSEGDTDTGGNDYLDCCGGADVSVFLQSPADVLAVSEEGLKRADSFMLAEASEIRRFRWWGTYTNTGQQAFEHDAFAVRVYADDDGAPGTLVASWSPGDVTRELTGELAVDDENPLFDELRWRFDFVLPQPLSVSASTRYWLSVLNPQQGDGVWMWEGGTPADVTGMSTNWNAEGWQADPYVDLSFQVFIADTCGQPEDSMCEWRRRMFLTHRTFTGDLGGVSGADQKCQDAADSAGLAGTFVAVLSAPGLNTWAHAGFNDLLYTRLDHAIVFNGLAPLPNDPDVPVNLNEFGEEESEASYAWTNTAPAGYIVSSTNSCGGWTSTSGTVAVGDAQANDGSWLQATTRSCAQSLRLYCVEIL